ncbi:hypothetical protein GDO78_011802 [Eleutherodactylus coqui]|uniref:SCAN domain-containing protein 3 n=1 Tax=Eleutherodactylus coqui TaxID=57060 RepID=A0A8J6F1G2_ELECQ|nr:hypothetical protein GDO78_011802 [Eleutherodactylus coqui]
MHSDNVGKPISFLQDLKSKFENRSTVGNLFGKSALNADKGLLPCYKVTLLIAQCGKSHTVGETLVLPAVKEIVSTMLGPNACAIVKSMPMSNDIVSRTIDKMAADSAVRDNEALLLAYIRFINRNEEVVEELLFTRNLTTDMYGSSIYKRVEEFFQEKQIPLTNVLACATNGAASMIGRYRVFITHLKSAIHGIMAVHREIHQQHLVAKHLCERLFDSLPYVINAVNKIKAQSLNKCFFSASSVYTMFPSLQEIAHKDGDKLQDTDLDVFCSHLKQAKEDMQIRFHDLCTLEIQTWVLNPFSADAGEFHPRLEEQLIDLKHESEAQALFQKCGYECFWMKVKNSYCILWQEVKLLVLTFPSMYLEERGFSASQQLLTKARNKLQIFVRGDLRLRLMKIEPDIAKSPCGN